LVEQFGAGRLVANVTGGTKVMSLAAYQVVAGAQVPCVYTDTPNRRLLYLYPEARAAEPLLSKVDVLTYLQAHGQQVALREASLRRSLPELARFIGQHITQVNPFLSRMRLAMRQARGTRAPNRVRFDLKGSQRHAKAAELLKRSMQAGLVRAEQGGKSEAVLTFADDSARRYLEGDWLEDLVFDTVRRNRFDEVATNVALFWQDNPEREMNEIDVAVVHNLRFYYISCKSGGDAAQMKNHVYELESLAELTGGVFNHPILVAASSKAVPAYLQRRMAALGMTYLGPKALPELASHLNTIIR
jgi:hypothetical protein